MELYQFEHPVAAKSAALAFWKETMNVTQTALSYPGATSDTDRAKKAPLSESSATDEELSPGERVEGLGSFLELTGEFGTVE